VKIVRSHARSAALTRPLGSAFKNGALKVPKHRRKSAALRWSARPFVAREPAESRGPRRKFLAASVIPRRGLLEALQFRCRLNRGLIYARGLRAARAKHRGTASPMLVYTVVLCVSTQVFALVCKQACVHTCAYGCGNRSRAK